jgi:hypothetical protein
MTPLQRVPLPGATDTPVSAREVARTLLVDVVTAEVVSMLADAGVPTILLKGPAIAHHFYAGGARRYLDIDLLVEAARVGDAGRVLQRLGFEDQRAGAAAHEQVPHAQEWLRRSDLVSLDLHCSLNEGTAPAETVWSELCTRTEQLRVGGSGVTILCRPATGAVVALHAAHHGRRVPEPLVDLERALEQLGLDEWEEAAQLARRLGADDALGAGLRLLPAGQALSATLGLPDTAPVALALRAASAPPLAERLAELLAERGLGRKAGFLYRRIWPSEAFLQLHWPLASRGPVGLVVARMQRLGHLGFQLWPSVRSLRRARQLRARDPEP